MDANRFDALSRTFATKLSRRSAVRRGGLGFAATLVAAAGLGRASASAGAVQAQPGLWYTVIRRYQLTGSADQVLGELNSGYLPLISQTDGYVSYSVVRSTDDTLTTITTFETQAQLESAAQSEEDWVAQNLASMLPAPDQTTSGDAMVFDTNADLICESDGGTTPTPTPVPPTPVPTGTPAACTGIGCPCNGGVQNACDDGLVCCQSQMGGGPIPGGEGMCAAADACGDATPVS